MNNLQTSRSGFRFEHTLSTDGAKRKVVIFEVIYLKSMRGDKGVRVSMRPSEVEQCDGYRSETTLLYNEANISAWARMVARKSDKAVLEVAEKLDPQVPAIIAAYLESPTKGRERWRQSSEGDYNEFRPHSSRPRGNSRPLLGCKRFA